MKKSISLLLSTLICALFFISCNVMTNCGYISDSDGFGLNEESVITVSIAELNTHSRTIFPKDWTSERAGALVFKLTGSTTENGANEITANNTFSYAQITNGTAKIKLTPELWYLKLTAYQQNGTDLDETMITADAVLADLSNGSTIVEFPLVATTNTTNATGDFEVTLSFPKPDNFFKVTYGLYQSGAMDAELATGFNAITKEVSDLTTVNAENNLYSFTYEENTVTAGTYYFNANFTDSQNRSIGYYSTLVYIDGGNISSDAISLSDMFNKPPRAASNLSVDYIFNSNALNPVELTGTDTIPSTYEAKFTWMDNSDNETGFELIVKDADDNAVTIDSTTITAGNLKASSTTVTITLDTGKVYNATLRPTNNFSPVATNDTYATLSNINLYTVTYNLNNGIIKTGSTTTTEATTTKYVVPFTSASTPSLIAGDTSTYPYIYRTSYNFENWVDSTDTAVTSISATNTDNIELTASWSATASIRVNLPTYGTLNVAILDTYDENAVINIAGAQTDPSTPVTISLSGGAGGVSQLTCTLYDYATSTAITDNITTSGNSWTWTINDDDNNIAVNAGIYRLAVSARIQGTPVSGNIYIRVTR